MINENREMVELLQQKSDCDTFDLGEEISMASPQVQPVLNLNLPRFQRQLSFIPEKCDNVSKNEHKPISLLI